MSNYNLFLDDKFLPEQIANLPKTNEKDRIRYRTYIWKIANTYEEFVNIVKEHGIPGIVSFDHDLAEEHWDFIYTDENWFKQDDAIMIDYDIFKIKTGYHAAEWLIEHCSFIGKEMPICLVHSQNEVGRKNIENLLF